MRGHATSECGDFFFVLRQVQVAGHGVVLVPVRVHVTWFGGGGGGGAVSSTVLLQLAPQGPEAVWLSTAAASCAQQNTFCEVEQAFLFSTKASSGFLAPKNLLRLLCAGYAPGKSWLILILLVHTCSLRPLSIHILQTVVAFFFLSGQDFSLMKKKKKKKKTPVDFDLEGGGGGAAGAEETTVSTKSDAIVDASAAAVDDGLSKQSVESVAFSFLFLKPDASLLQAWAICC